MPRPGAAVDHPQRARRAPLPTRCENPFRSSMGAHNQPIADLAQVIGADVNATLLRHDFLTAPANNPTSTTAGVLKERQRQ